MVNYRIFPWKVPGRDLEGEIWQSGLIHAHSFLPLPIIFIFICILLYITKAVLQFTAVED
jgi:hypothetical protein